MTLGRLIVIDVVQLQPVSRPQFVESSIPAHAAVPLQAAHHVPEQVPV